jgi:hypothetical protein
MKVDFDVTAEALRGAAEGVFELSARKLELLRAAWKTADGAPVFTVDGRYASRGWTEWTRGFMCGSELLQFDATGERRALERGLADLDAIEPLAYHTGVHDHGFNIVSSFGAVLRLIGEERIGDENGLGRLCAFACRCSGSLQVQRWTQLADGGGFVFSFNGSHSLFIDTLRSLRSPALALQLGAEPRAEGERRVDLLGRLLAHVRTTARHAVYYGTGRDAYDRRGRVAHESLFNTLTGEYRCPSTQQGYSPFSTWMRGLAWAICGFAEQLEFLESLSDTLLEPHGGRAAVLEPLLEALDATAEFYLEETPADGVPYWDSGAPGLERMPDWREREADPFNAFEPVDSSAAAIAAQGLLRYGEALARRGRADEGRRLQQAALTIAARLFGDPYLSREPEHQGLLLHSVYHRPAGWDAVPGGRSVPCGESSMWGDYHLRELALMLLRRADGGPAYRFFLPAGHPSLRRDWC